MALFGVSSTTLNNAVTILQNQINALKTAVGNNTTDITALTAKDVAQDAAQKWNINPDELKIALDKVTADISLQVIKLRADIAAIPAPFDPAPFQAQIDLINAQLLKLNAFMEAAYKDDPNVINLNTFPPTT